MYMKIVIIGSARSKSTILAEQIKHVYPNLHCYYELYTYQLKKNYSIEEITSTINQDDYIVKIMGHNLRDNIEHFDLERYDKIICVERQDFFDQCCSLQVCLNTGIWHQRGSTDCYTTVRTQEFELENGVILQQAHDISNYLTIKQYLINKNLPFITKSYHEIDYGSINGLAESNLIYDKIILNYHWKDSINDCFVRNFSYAPIKNNLNDFRIGLDNLVPPPGYDPRTKVS